LILDTSAVIAVVRRELVHRDLEDAMAGANPLAIGAPTMFEIGLVALGRFGRKGWDAAARFLQDWDVEVISFDERHARVALDAFARYGKGRHPAGLNYGDCMTYAIARVAGLPLLFTGEDFAQTDVAIA